MARINNNLLCLFIFAFWYISLPDEALARRVTTDGGTKAADTAKSSVPKDWKVLLDPTTDEFWKEGNHVPDAGFLLWAKNPTIENAKFYLLRMNAKRDRLHLMQKQQEEANKELIKAGLIADDYDFLTEVTRPNSKERASLDQFTQIFFLFSPTCPHCKRQAQIFREQTQIVPMQIGGQTLNHFDGLGKSVWASNEDIQKYASKGVVPVLLVYDKKTNNMTSVQGVHTISELSQIVSLLRKEASKK